MTGYPLRVEVITALKTLLAIDVVLPTTSREGQS